MAYNLKQEVIEDRIIRTSIFVMAAALIVVLGQDAQGQSNATGCLNPGGQLSRVQVGDEPLGGECRVNQREVSLLLDQDGRDVLTVNEEVDLGSRSDVGVLGDFEFSVACTALDATRILIRLDATNTTDEELTVLTRPSAQNVAAPGSFFNLWAPQAIPPMLDFVADSRFIIETHDFYIIDMHAAAPEREYCIFAGTVSWFPGSDVE